MKKRKEKKAKNETKENSFKKCSKLNRGYPSYIIMMLTRRFYSLFGAEEQFNTKLSDTYSFAHSRFVRLLQVPNPWALTLKCR